MTREFRRNLRIFTSLAMTVMACFSCVVATYCFYTTVRVNEAMLNSLGVRMEGVNITYSYFLYNRTTNKGIYKSSDSYIELNNYDAYIASNNTNLELFIVFEVLSDVGDKVTINLSSPNSDYLSPQVINSKTYYNVSDVTYCASFNSTLDSYSYDNSNPYDIYYKFISSQSEANADRTYRALKSMLDNSTTLIQTSLVDIVTSDSKTEFIKKTSSSMSIPVSKGSNKPLGVLILDYSDQLISSYLSRVNPSLDSFVAPDGKSSEKFVGDLTLTIS
ncbi:MAG: hypothetical protein SPI88_00480 [Bacilli bacterium]|nr:hypothetical protein [Bacilli bacterium]